MNTLSEIKEAFIHLLYPHICAGCGSDLLSAHNLICLNCLQALPETQFHLFPGNPVETAFYGRLPVQHATAQYYFTKESLMQILLHELKYKGNKKLGIFLGRLMGEQMMQAERFAGVDALVPLPLHASREKKRGFNQAELICKGMASVWDKPVLNQLVLRNTNTESQTKKGRIDRWKNMEGKFEIKDPSMLSAQHILLVDDVITTGATLEACGQSLLDAGLEKLSVATLCYAIA
jgi:ComF family protein